MKRSLLGCVGLHTVDTELRILAAKYKALCGEDLFAEKPADPTVLQLANGGGVVHYTGPLYGKHPALEHTH